MKKLTQEQITEKENTIKLIGEVDAMIDGDTTVKGKIGCDLDHLASNLKVQLLFGVELPEFYGEYCDLNGCGAHPVECLMWMDGEHRTISWSDDDRQPSGEWLYCIGFSTGAYIFGDHYPTGLFKQFWDDLKSGVNYKYSDTANHRLYITPSGAYEAHLHLRSTLKKYQDMVADDKKRIEIEKLKRKLAEMEGEVG